MSPLHCPQDRRNHRFSFRKEKKPNFLSKFLQKNRHFSQDTRKLTEDSEKKFTTVEHINQSMSPLAAPTPASTQISRATIQHRFVLSNP